MDLRDQWLNLSSLHAGLFFVILFSSADFFVKINTFEKIIQEYHQSVSNSLDPDQARHFGGPDLDPNCLQRLLSADDT